MGDDAGAMGGVEPSGNLRADAQRLGYGKRTALELLFEGLAFEILHHQVIDSALLANVKDRPDIGVLEAGNGAGLILKTLAEIVAAAMCAGRF